MPWGALLANATGGVARVGLSGRGRGRRRGVARRVNAVRHADGVAAVVGLVRRHLVASVRRHVTYVHLPIVRAVALALLHRGALPRGCQDALERVQVTRVSSDALIGAVDTVARKGLRAIGVETGALGTGAVVRVDHRLAAPTAEVVRHTRLAACVLGAVILSCRERCKAHDG